MYLLVNLLMKLSMLWSAQGLSSLGRRAPLLADLYQARTPRKFIDASWGGVPPWVENR